MDYQRIYRQKVRDMQYTGVRTFDEDYKMSPQAKRLADDLTRDAMSFSKGYISLPKEEQKNFVKNCKYNGMPFTAVVAQAIIKG